MGRGRADSVGLFKCGAGARLTSKKEKGDALGAMKGLERPNQIGEWSRKQS
jgi:hypothetical protein